MNTNKKLADKELSNIVGGAKGARVPKGTKGTKGGHGGKRRLAK